MTADDIKLNLAVAQQILDWARQRRAGPHPLSEPVAPAPLEPETLSALTGVIKHEDGPTNAALDAARPLVEHAAWHIRQAFPNATYPSHPSDHTIPTLDAICQLASTWPAAIRNPAKPEIERPVKGRSLSKRKGARLPADTMATLELLEARRQAESKFQEHLANTGELPPSPPISQVKTRMDEAVREGWFDAASRTLPGADAIRRDIKSGPVAEAWQPGKDPVSLVVEELAQRDTKRVRGKPARPLEEIRAQQAAEITYRYDGRTASRTRSAITEAAHAAAHDITHAVWAVDEPGQVSEAAEVGQLVRNALDLIADLIGTANIQDADAIARRTRPLVNATNKLQKQRKERNQRGTGPKSAQYDTAAMRRFTAAIEKAKAIAAKGRDDTPEPVREGWLQVQEWLSQALAAAQSYTLPEKESMWESDERELLSTLTEDELRERAVLTFFEQHGQFMNEVLLIPDRWIVEISMQEGEKTIRLIEDIETAAGKLEALIRERTDLEDTHRRTFAALISGNAEVSEEDSPAARIQRIGQAMDFHLNEDGSWAATAGQPLRTLVHQLSDLQAMQTLNSTALKSAHAALEILLPAIHRRRWGKAVRAVNTWQNATVVKQNTRRSMDQGVAVTALHRTLYDLQATLTTLEREERESAQHNTAIRLALPNDNAQPIPMAL